MDFSPTLNVVNYTLSSTSSTSSTSLLNCFTYNLSDSPSPYLTVNKWSVGLFWHCMPTKWCINKLLSWSKLSMEDCASLLNYTYTAPFSVIEKDWHTISSGVYCRLKVILKVVMWSNGSFNPSYDSSCRRRNFGGKGHSRTFNVNGESILFTIPSKFFFFFPSSLSSSISLIMLLRRSLLASLDSSVLLEPSFPWLPSGSWASSSLLLFSILHGERFFSCCNCCFISWFWYVSSFTLAIRAWICKDRVADSSYALDSIWILTMVGQRLLTLRLERSSHRRRKIDETKFVSRCDRPNRTVRSCEK